MSLKMQQMFFHVEICTGKNLKDFWNKIVFDLCSICFLKLNALIRQSASMHTSIHPVSALNAPKMKELFFLCKF